MSSETSTRGTWRGQSACFRASGRHERSTIMRGFDIRGIDLAVPPEKAFAFISNPAQLPKWTKAFASVSGGRAVMRTPDGEVTVDLEVQASAEQRTIDWLMTFPDRSEATAYSRIVPLGRNRC